MKGDIHTFHEGGRWKNRVASEFGTLSEHATREHAISAGRAAARSRGVEHVIEHLDGTVAERHDYGPAGEQSNQHN